MFEERERAFEAKYSNDQDVAFRLHARRDKIFGLWVAAQLGYAADQAEHYAHTLVILVEPHRETALMQKVTHDLAMAGKTVTQQEIDAAFRSAHAEARAQMIAEDAKMK